jgi:hypothetical protein
MRPTKSLLNEREAAQLLNCSVALLRKQRYLGIGCRYVKLDRLVRYRPEDIEAYIADHLAEVVQGRDAVANDGSQRLNSREEVGATT